MMRVLILANGEPPSQALLARLAAEHNLFIAVDGAALKSVRLGVLPNIVSGDFDSLDLDAARAALPDAEFLPTPDQNHTDLEKAFQIARERGASEITIAGAAGGRIDHTLGNFSRLLRWREELPDFPVVIVEDGSEVRAMAGEMTLNAELGDVISLLSYDGKARVSLSGVRWPLEDHLLPVGVGGLLNEAVSPLVPIKAAGGMILVCHLRAWRRQHS
jgi:thiamine pyrophosphokinase